MHDLQVDISVIMPVHNTARFLARSIRSILSQRLANFELVIIDDGSTDASGEIAHIFARRDARVRVFDQPQRGISAARNAGLAVARGALLAVMDSDDIAMPNRLSEQARFMESNPSVMVCGSNVRRIDSLGLTISIENRPTQHAEILQWLLHGDGGAIRQPSCIMRTNVVRKIGGYRLEYSATEDLDLYLRLCDHGTLANIPEVLLAYRQHAGSTTVTKRQLQRQNAVIIVSEACERWGLSNEEFGKIEAFLPIGPDDAERMISQEALRHRRRLPALIHALNALRIRPNARSNWTVLARLMLGESGYKIASYLKSL